MNEAELLYRLLIIDYIEKPQLGEEQKINGRSNFVQIHLIRNNKRQYLFEYGAASNSLDFILTEEEAFKNLADAINNFQCKIRFHAMYLPNSSVYEANKIIFKNVFIRSISYYEVRIDEMLTRLDVLIEKLDN